MSGRELLLTRALDSVPKLLMLQDRNPLSPTYGCFDRNYWHYKIIDFPSGMAQEFVLPLALAFAVPTVGNQFAGNDMIREWVRAGIAFAARSAHSDGSCDDYYPFEKAAGAAAFSLYAALRAIEFAGLDAKPFLSFLQQRGRWLYNHHEPGELSNHEALIANGLIRLSQLTEMPIFCGMAEKRLERLLGLQSTEGWFFEYQGCDPGYLTLTVSMLAEMQELKPDLGLDKSIARSVRFLAAIQPPDGWFGGEWTSRNTHNYFPHGFELCGRWLPQALQVNDAAIAALRDPPEYGDDHIIGHHCWSYFLAAMQWVFKRPPPRAFPDKERLEFEEAGILIDRRGSRTLLLATKKGGAFRFYEGSKLLHADTGVALAISSGRRSRIAVCHLWAKEYRLVSEGKAMTISGQMAWAKSMNMTPVKLLVLRLVMLAGGRFKPELVRWFLQRLLITGRSLAPFGFTRRVTFSATDLEVEDEVTSQCWDSVTSAWIGTAQASIYNVMSRVFHPSQLEPWTNLTSLIPKGRGGVLFVKRVF